MTQARSREDLGGLAAAAREAPIVSSYSNLAARILSEKHGVKTIDSVKEFCRQISDPTHQFGADVIIRDQTAQMDVDRELTTYRPPSLEYVNYTGSTYTPELNAYTNSEWFSWQDVEETTLSQSAIADRIVSTASRADVIALVIIDGLSYHDWRRVDEPATPVYVDCPTITECGYPNVVSGGATGKSIARPLHNRGFKDRRAFTYWEKNNNSLTERLHKPFSANDVVGDIEDFDDVMANLQAKEWDTDNRTYIQITLTGPERVAHRMKENPDVDAQVGLVQSKLDRLWTLLSKRVSSARLFATADHGILWRMDVPEGFSTIAGPWDHTKRRYLTDPPAEWDLPTHAGRSEIWDGTEYFRLDYPSLLHSMRNNEPGTHGGFSYQESIVPLIEYH